MKSLMAGLFVLLPTASFATFDMQCGPKGNGKHAVDLHIEDGQNPPKDWNLLVDGKKPFASDQPTIKMGKKRIVVTLPGGGDSNWTDYEFQVPADCDSGTYNGKVSVYVTTIPDRKFVRSYLCNCIED